MKDVLTEAKDLIKALDELVQRPYSAYVHPYSDSADQSLTLDAELVKSLEPDDIGLADLLEIVAQFLDDFQRDQGDYNQAELAGTVGWLVKVKLAELDSSTPQR